MSQFANYFFKRTPYDIKSLAEIVDASYSAEADRFEFVQKETFSPSTIGYMSGRCPRRWYLLFKGADVEEKHSSQSVDNMSAGTSAHERIQANFKNSDLDIEVEHELWSEDPPVHGFVDIIIRNYNGYDIVIEIKTTRTEAFTSRKAKNAGPDYQVMQLLLYMYLLEIDHGLLLYEDKNDHDKLLIPVEMTPENRQRIEGVVEWMRTVHATYKQDKLPERPYRSNAKECKSCPIQRYCFDQPQGDIKLEPLDF